MQVVQVTTREMLEKAFRIRMEVFVEEQGVPSELEMDEYDVSPEACRHFLLLADGEPAATGRWKEYEPGMAKMQRIAVRKALRGQGLGKELLLGMEKDASARGYSKAVLDAQCSAEEFYAKLGYATISTEPFLDADIWHVRMTKSI